MRRILIMRFIVLALILGFPIAEGTLLYHLAVGPQGHGGWVLAWLIFAAIGGVVLIKQARFSLVSRLASALSQGQFSLAAVIDSFRTVLAGLLLIFPGLISDLLALCLLLMPVREPAYERVRSNTRPDQPVRSGSVIDGEFRRER
jgi:UPF0716 protein FxsA